MEDGNAAFEKQDFATALKKFKSAAEKNNAYAQLQVGNFYNEGIGVIQDYAEAVRWYKLAAEYGNTTAQFNLGNMYRNAQGVVQDYAEAVRWYKLAAAQGDAMACASFSVMDGEQTRRAVPPRRAKSKKDCPTMANILLRKYPTAREYREATLRHGR